MITINANRSSNILSNPKYYYANQLQTEVQSITYYYTLADKTNSYLYSFLNKSATDWFAIRRFSEDKTSVILTLSWFWTFSTQPNLMAYQGSHSWDYYVYCAATGGSASFTVGNIYPVTISGTTATLWAAITPPTVASNTLAWLAFKWSTIYAWYYLTAWSTMNEVRKYTWSWWTLTWSALPSSAWCVYGAWFQHSCQLWTGTNMDNFYFRGTNSTSFRFNSTNETWYTHPDIIYWCDVDWYALGNSTIYNPDLTYINIQSWTWQICFSKGVSYLSKWLIIEYTSWSQYRLSWKQNLTNNTITRCLSSWVSQSYWYFIIASWVITFIPNYIVWTNYVSDFLNIDVTSWVILMLHSNPANSFVEYM